jgi:hypothetical protein
VNQHRQHLVFAARRLSQQMARAGMIGTVMVAVAVVIGSAEWMVWLIVGWMLGTFGASFAALLEAMAYGYVPWWWPARWHR